MQVDGDGFPYRHKLVRLEDEEVKIIERNIRLKSYVTFNSTLTEADIHQALWPLNENGVIGGFSSLIGLPHS